MKIVIRRPRPTGEEDPSMVQRVVDIVEEGRPVTAAAIAKRVHLCEMAVSRIIYRHYDLHKPGPAHEKRVKREWAPVSGEPGRLQETLFTLVPDEVVIED